MNIVGWIQDAYRDAVKYDNIMRMMQLEDEYDFLKTISKGEIKQMDEIRKKIIATENTIKTINSLIDENIRDIGSDTKSEYSQMRIMQNADLLYAAKLLTEMLEEYAYTD